MKENKFAKYRRFIGKSQTEMAELLNVTQPAICQYERSKRKPDIYVLDRMRKALKISADKLLDMFLEEQGR